MGLGASALGPHELALERHATILHGEEIVEMVEARLMTRPKISIVIPTLNAGALLENCLASVLRQTYPRDAYEILVADAHSTDGTPDIARRFGALVFDDDGTNMEEGKRLALSHARGDYVCFLDADNEFSDADYLALAVEGLERFPQALGVESYYPPSPKMSSFCAYLTHLLHISDPVSWLMSGNPILVGTQGDVERWMLPGQSVSYPLGANGFVFRKSDLDAVCQGRELFQDTHVAMHLMQSGKREWLRIRGRGVHHYYIQTLWAFVRKRRRAIAHYWQVRTRAPASWSAKPTIPAWLAALYCVSLVGPLFHALAGFFRSRDPRWFWHVPASLASLLGTLWGTLTFWLNRHDARLVAKLQPQQSLKKS